MVNDGDDVEERKRNRWLAVVLAMTFPGLASSAADVEPTQLIEYANVQGTALHAHVFAAEAGEPPHPAILFFFGGGWSSGTPRQFYPFAAQLAKEGFVAIPMEYRVRQRHGSSIPDSMADAFTAFRWAQDRAGELGIDPARIGLIGSSSGGHLALLAAIQPDLEAHRGTAVVGGPDAEQASAAVNCVVALWPVSDPLHRFDYAQRVGREELVAAHRRYYRDEDHMREASVQRALAHGEAQRLPPLLVVQPGEDANVPREMTLELVSAYQDAGGVLSYLFLPGLPHAFAYQASADTTRLARDILTFLARHL